ncbi:MAG: SDR family NAD(P)-dependent oxidoreductase [Pseudomonadota bacterium]|nr:SDR family NAD(P)-dependent oxidoreductase [Pseudomonadota bacterium]
MNPVTGRLAGKIAVVVGAGQTPGETIGNGRAMATLFARAGAKVVCVDRAIDRAGETVAAITTEGGTALAMAADVRSTADVDAMIAGSVREFGRIDIMVNNVGIGGGGDAPAHKLSEDALELILDVNLKGAWRCIHAVLPAMRAQQGGAIVNISSLAAHAGGIQTAYEVSKAALNRLTTSVAIANARYGIRCNAVQPGLMDTPMAITGISTRRGLDPAVVRAERDARVPLKGKMGSGWDTAYAALFLASDEAAFITGAILPVDGGGGARVG